MRAPQVFCYMTSWSQKRPGAGKFTPENIDASLCTHVIYAFATLKEHKLATTEEKDADMYERVVALREKNPNLQVSRVESRRVESSRVDSTLVVKQVLFRLLLLTAANSSLPP